MRTLLIIVGFVQVVNVIAELTTSFTITKNVKDPVEPAAEKAAE